MGVGGGEWESIKANNYTDTIIEEKILAVMNTYAQTNAPSLSNEIKRATVISAINYIMNVITSR